MTVSEAQKKTTKKWDTKNKARKQYLNRLLKILFWKKLPQRTLNELKSILGKENTERLIVVENAAWIIVIFSKKFWRCFLMIDLNSSDIMDAQEASKIW